MCLGLRRGCGGGLLLEWLLHLLRLHLHTISSASPDSSLHLALTFLFLFLFLSRSLVAVSFTPARLLFLLVPIPPTRGPDGGYWSESGEQIAWKNLPRGYLPTYLSTSLAIYMHLYPTYHHPLTYTKPATLRPIHSAQVNAFPLDEQRIETRERLVSLENDHASGVLII